MAKFLREMLMMKCRIESWFFSWVAIWLIPEHAFGEKIKPKTVLSTAYEDIRIGKRISGSGPQLEGVKSRAKCDVACSKNEKCLSFIFCGDSTCYLNEEDVFSTENGDEILEDDETCLYFGMQKESVPVCRRNGIFADIRNDDNSGACKLAHKRVDQQWGEWEDDSVASDNEWKESKRRTLITEAAHGGLQGQLDSEEVTHWFLFIREKMTWTEAKDNCEKLGASLFWNLDGTKEMLEEFWIRLDSEDYWIGIQTEDQSTWKTVNDEVIDDELIPWNENKNNRDSGNVVALQGKENGNSKQVSVSVVNESLLLMSVCDKTPGI